MATQLNENGRALVKWNALNALERHFVQYNVAEYAQKIKFRNSLTYFEYSGMYTKTLSVSSNGRLFHAAGLFVACLNN